MLSMLSIEEFRAPPETNELVSPKAAGWDAASGAEDGAAAAAGSVAEVMVTSSAGAVVEAEVVGAAESAGVEGPAAALPPP